MVTLVKFQGLDEPWTLINPGRWDICQDWLDQRVSEILVFITNQDKTDRNRYVQPTGESTRILVSSVPCVKLQGSAKMTSKGGGITETLSASGVEFQSYGYIPGTPPYANILSPDIGMHLIKGSATWKIEGVDGNGCTYSGSRSYTLTEENNPSQLTLYFDLLPGSRRYLGYEGTGGLDSPTPEASYTRSCPDGTSDTFEVTPGDFFMPDGETPVNPDGTLTGDVTIDQGGGFTLRWEWNFSPVAQ